MDGRFCVAARWAGMFATRCAPRRWMLLAAPALLVGSWLQSDLFDRDGGAASAATARSTNIIISAYVPLVCTATSAANAKANPVISGPNTENVSIAVATPASVCSDGSQASVAVEQSSGVLSATGLENSAGASSYVAPDGTRVLVAELALDGRASPLRLVTVTY
jgi:hypothetical protein